MMKVENKTGMMILFVSFMLLSSFLSGSAGAIDVSACGTLSTENGYYTLTNDISSSGTCLTIGANNITLNGAGYYINYSKSFAGYGIDNSGGFDNITIKNITVTKGNESNFFMAGIYASGMTGSSIVNATIATSGNSEVGIYLQSSSNGNNITHVNITTTGSNADGIRVFVSRSNSISGVFINTTGSNAYSVIFAGLGVEGTINNNITDSTMYSKSRVLSITQSSENTNDYITNNIMSASGTDAVVNVLAHQTFFINNTITSSTAYADAFSVRGNVKNTSVIGGSITAYGNAYDYYFETNSATNNFTATNFTAKRRVWFNDATSWFNYNNQTNGNIWLKTSVSAQSSINRTLVNWNNTLMKWNDTNSTAGIRANYNLTGLLASRAYNITNTSSSGSYSQMLATDSGGNLPSFSIFLVGNTEINAELTYPPQWKVNATYPNSPQTYNPSNNYGFQINWTDSDNNFANATFQLGRPSGTLTNYTQDYAGASLPEDNSLVLHMKLDTVNGTNYTPDSSQYRNNGLMKNFEPAPINNFSAAIFANGTRFDGVNDYVDAGNDASLNFNNKTFSILYWFNSIDSASDQRTIIDKGFNNFITVGHFNNHLFFGYPANTKNVTGISTLISNVWYYAAFIWNGTNISLYLNGQIDKTETITISTDQTINWNIGRNNWGGYYQGSIDEVRIYNRSLSANEILAQYNAGVGRYIQNFTQAAIGGAGTYNYTWFGTDTAGLQNKTDDVGYVINKAPTSTRLFLNGTEGNRNYNMFKVANITVALNTSGKTAYLNSNMSGWAITSGVSQIYNYTQLLAGGVFNLTGYFLGDENYSASSATHFANVVNASSIILSLAVHLGSAFSDDIIRSGNLHECIQDGNGWFGLTAESPTQAQSGNLSADYSVNVSFASDSNAFIALGSGSCMSFRNRAADAQLKRFLSPLIAFSYAKTNLIQLILRFNSTHITNDAHWGKGTYLLSIANQGYNSSSGKQNLAVRIVK